MSSHFKEKRELNEKMLDRYGETPLYSGRAIALLANDRNILELSGKRLIVAELADKYGFNDEFGQRPLSLRDIRHIVGLFPIIGKYLRFLPSVPMPFWLSKILLARIVHLNNIR